MTGSFANARQQRGASASSAPICRGVSPSGDSVGGTNDLENIVTACWPCNFGRDGDTIEELGLVDPRSRPPVLDDWDGLMSILRYPAPKRPTATHPSLHAEPVIVAGKASRPSWSLAETARQDRQAGWATRIDQSGPGVSAALISFAESCASVGISYAINKVMLLHVPAASSTIAAIGIDPELGVLIPWSIGSHKQASWAFAVAIAAAIPGAIAYENPKMWSVRKRGANDRLENLSPFDLLGASDKVRCALNELSIAVQHACTGAHAASAGASGLV